MLNSMRSPELTIKVNLNNNGADAVLASIKELDPVPEKLGVDQSERVSNEYSNNLSKTKSDQNSNVDDYSLNTSQENDSRQNVSLNQILEKIILLKYQYISVYIIIVDIIKYVSTLKLYTELLY